MNNPLSTSSGVDNRALTIPLAQLDPLSLIELTPHQATQPRLISDPTDELFSGMPTDDGTQKIDFEREVWSEWDLREGTHDGETETEYCNPEYIRRPHTKPLGLPSGYNYTRRHRHQRKILRENAQHFVDSVGSSRVGFLILTFEDNLSAKEANKVFNRLTRRFLPQNFGPWLRVVEKTKSGRIHFHLLIDCKEEIASDFDVEAYKLYIEQVRKGQKGLNKMTNGQRLALRDRIKCNAHLRSLWSLLDENLRNLGFGRAFDLFPLINSSAQVINYLSKQYTHSQPRFLKLDRGRRSITYSKNFPRKVPPGPPPPSKWFAARCEAVMKIAGMENKTEMQECLGRGWPCACLSAFPIIEAEVQDENWFKTPDRYVRSIVRVLRTSVDSKIFLYPLAERIRDSALSKSPHHTIETDLRSA